MGSASYTYRAQIVRWLDGDTVEVSVDLGFHVSTSQTVRVYGVNCPESKGATKAAGLAAKAFAEALAGPGAMVAIKSYKSGSEKYGRWLASIFTDSGKDVAAELIHAGHGCAYDGGKRT